MNLGSKECYRLMASFLSAFQDYLNEVTVIEAMQKD